MMDERYLGPAGGLAHTTSGRKGPLSYHQNRLKDSASPYLRSAAHQPIDWHEWNEHENRAYPHWLMEERRERQYREYRRLKAEQQREYWRWRHQHPDWR